MRNKVLVLVGTTKGAFFLSSDGKRKSWEVSGPHFPGQPVYAMAYHRKRVFAATQNPFFGTAICHTDNFGRTWTVPKALNVKFPKATGLDLKQIWQITPADDVIYCGVEPAALFVSKDNGETWSFVKGLHDHPHRPKWEPGGGGLCLHTILPHPKDAKKMMVAISTGGVYRTENGGKSWTASNNGIRADFMPNKFPEFGQCVHKVVRHASQPERLFLQNHGGLYRSDDEGRTWIDIGKGVPSDFGFPIVMHPHRPETIYVVPLTPEGRWVPDGSLAVWRSANGGRSWEGLRRGLPQEGAYETVLRDGMAADTMEDAGIYFGTRSGKVYGSSNSGGSWKQMVDSLPPIVCVKTAVVGKP